MTWKEFFNLIDDISEDDVSLITDLLRIKTFKKGDLIVVPGQIQKELYFVKSGVQMSYFETDDKKHVIAFTYHPGLCAIPESFSSQTPSKYYLTCLEDSEMEYLSYEDMQLLLKKSHSFERLIRKMTEAVLAGLINRHIELHSQSMEERFLTFCKRSPHLLHLVPHKHLASYFGIDATNFSKLFNKVKI